MASFSWYDALNAAVGSCLPCFRRAPPDNTTTTNHNTVDDELDRLLIDPDADTLSLHSNLGDRTGRRTRKRRAYLPKRISIFGYHLFGRPPIHLSDDNDDDDENSMSRRRGVATTASLSTSTLDSDAAPLDVAHIAPEQLRAAAEAEEEERRRKEERRRRRRERRERREQEAALAMGAEAEEFEGFQGSGASFPQAPPFRSLPSPSAGGIVHLQVDADVDLDADAADLGGELYTRGTNGGTSNGSDSRSRTSASTSDLMSPRYLPTQSMHVPPHVPPQSLSHPSSVAPTVLLDAPRRKKAKSGSSSRSKSSSATSQSQSLPSPVQSQSPSPFVDIGPASPLMGGYADVGGFPSVGLGGTRGGGRAGVKGDMVAFLAHRGDS